MAKIWLIGASQISTEHAKVLSSLKEEYLVIGRGEKSSKAFFETTGIKPIIGGVDEFIKSNPECPSYAIVAVSEESLLEVTNTLLKFGVKNILVEKPGGYFTEDFRRTIQLASSCSANVVLGYNRRFFASVMAAKKIISEDGGITSFNFEFTEWAFKVAPDHRAKEVFEYWFLGNSTHVIDTAFFLGGWPKELTCFHKGGLEWHPSGSIYAGAGVSESGALFSYQANWEAPGRWVVEILTKKHRLYFKPMETLQIQDIGSVRVNPVEIDDHLDKEFKPGLYLQTKAFLERDYSRFCTIEQQKEHIEKVYNKMSGYEL